MLFVELVSALFTPVLDVFAPIFMLFAEFVFWLILIIVRFILALVRWRKPEIPTKPNFSRARGKLISYSKAWRQKLGNKNRS